MVERASEAHGHEIAHTKESVDQNRKLISENKKEINALREMLEAGRTTSNPSVHDDPAHNT